MSLAFLEDSSCGYILLKPCLDPEITDPGLLRKHSTLRSYTTSIASYPAIRTFYRPHPQADQLPSKPVPLPLLVFVHGLGGSLAQFNPLLTSLVNISACLGIDLPGCGLSKYSPALWNAYTTEALAELLMTVIDLHLDHGARQGVVLIAHSMGCALSALLASTTSTIQYANTRNVLGLVAISPQMSPFSEHQIKIFLRLLHIPTPLFDLWRKWDRRGGPESVSVTRIVGANADVETKKLQQRFNAQSDTEVWRRMAWGALPTSAVAGTACGGLPGPEVWAGIATPIFLMAGEADTITKPEEIGKISQTLGKAEGSSLHADHHDSLSPTPNQCLDSKLQTASVKQNSDGRDQRSASNTETTLLGDVELSHDPNANVGPAPTRKRRVLKTSILPAPASHAMLYDHSTYRTLAGLIQSFLSDHIDSRLSLGWQLQHLSTEGKWDVKNLAKWQAVAPVSASIAGIFRAMKTLREIDDTHSPLIFVKHWKGKIKAVIDISHESPVYDPQKMDDEGIEYHKFPTVSKIPPTIAEVEDFINLVDRLRDVQASPHYEYPLIGVHCHYGFNRTGFFICSYLIEKEGFSVQQAIDEFRKQRPPGIRHDHFIDTLFVRYCVGLKRAPSMS